MEKNESFLFGRKKKFQRKDNCFAICFVFVSSSKTNRDWVSSFPQTLQFNLLYLVFCCNLTTPLNDNLFDKILIFHFKNSHWQRARRFSSPCSLTVVCFLSFHFFTLSTSSAFSVFCILLFRSPLSVRLANAFEALFSRSSLEQFLDFFRFFFPRFFSLFLFLLPRHCQQTLSHSSSSN